MASVLVLHDYSDAEDAEAARCDLRWKAACGFPLDHAGFDPSTLVYWRRRLARSERPHRISDAVRKVTRAAGEENSDATVAAQFLANQAADDGQPCQWYGDSAYGTGDLRAAIGKTGYSTVIKPGPLRPTAEGSHHRRLHRR